jgi:tripartite-type tricarboxylate transporter receptor subunit TctC
MHWSFIKSVVLCLIVFTGLLPLSGSLHAQEFPTKPINLVIPFGSGGSSDLTARTFVQLSTEYLGQPMIIQIKPGGGGAIGSEFVAQAKPDGHTLLLGHINCNSILPAVEGRSKGPDDLAVVGQINTLYSMFVVQANSPFKTLKDMVEWAKANPDRLTFGNIGNWGVTEFEWRYLASKTGMKTRMVPYDGGGEALIGLLGGHVQTAILAPTQSLPHIRAGKLRALAVTGPKRNSELPDVPAMTEEGYAVAVPGGVWKAVFAPKGTPQPVIDKLSAAFKKMTENKQAIASLKQIGDEFAFMGPDEFTKYWRSEFQNIKEMGKTLKK